MILFLEQFNPVIKALIATLFTWGMVAIGATSGFFSKDVSRKLLGGMLGIPPDIMTILDLGLD